jgi:hypothetical protein
MSEFVKPYCPSYYHLRTRRDSIGQGRMCDVLYIPSIIVRQYTVSTRSFGPTCTYPLRVAQSVQQEQVHDGRIFQAKSTSSCTGS